MPSLLLHLFDSEPLLGFVGEKEVESSSLLYTHSKLTSRETLMDEQRKYAILFAATLLSARKLIEMDPDKPNMAKGYFVDRAIDDATFILERIDKRWPSTPAPGKS